MLPGKYNAAPALPMRTAPCTQRHLCHRAAKSTELYLPVPATHCSAALQSRAPKPAGTGSAQGKGQPRGKGQREHTRQQGRHIKLQALHCVPRVCGNCLPVPCLPGYHSGMRRGAAVGCSIQPYILSPSHTAAPSSCLLLTPPSLHPLSELQGGVTAHSQDKPPGCQTGNTVQPS